MGRYIPAPVHAAHTDDGAAAATHEIEAPKAPAKAKADKPKARKAAEGKNNGHANGHANGNGAAKAATGKAKQATVAKPKAEAKPDKAKPKKATAKATPRQRDPAKLDQWGLRKDSIRSRAAAIYAKGKGATLEEVKEQVGSVQFNVLTELMKSGHEVTNDAVKNSKGRIVTRYKLHPKAKE